MKELAVIRVEAPSRLHFGFLNPPGAAAAEECALRSFGGVGLMVREPGLRLLAEPATDWGAAGPGGERALAFARRFAEAAGAPQRCAARLLIEQAPPEHAGLGSGTQLGLTVARALTAAWGLESLDAPTLARFVGRGQRSALGVHGFAHGGFLVESGKHQPNEIAPLVARHDFPEEWAVLLLIPRRETGLHGADEIQAFRTLSASRRPEERADRLCRLVLLGLLPSLVDRAVDGFGEALYAFNRLVGECFAPVQGGVYAGPLVTAVVDFLREEGIRGVAQSSWGPTVAAISDDPHRLKFLGRAAARHFGFAPEQTVVTQACNHGAILSQT